MKRPVAASLLLSVVCSLAVFGCNSAATYHAVHIADFDRTAGVAKIKSRDFSSAKLSPDLLRLAKAANGGAARSLDAPATKTRAFSDRELLLRFGITDLASPVGVMIQFTSPPTLFASLGITPFFTSENHAYADVPVTQLEALAADPAIKSISPLAGDAIPPQPNAKIAAQDKSRALSDLVAENTFNTSGMTGKGVIVGVIDTGIDWTHEDFINADGTSRILYLYDPYDDSFTKSNGAIGTKPPVNDAKGKPFGTLYTREQLNAALAGKGTVNSQDTWGHGTACAGTAAGNGRAAGNGIAPGTFKGVAPEADLIVVRAMPKGSLSGSIGGSAAKWIAETAAARKQPCVISMSFGGHFSGHDGGRADEQLLDDLLTATPNGLVMCISAGNEGQFNLHASSRFGPKRAGQADTEGSPAELNVKDDTTVDAYFDRKDDWSLVVSGFPTTDGKTASIALWLDKDGDATCQLLPKGAKIDFKLQDFIDNVEVLDGGPKQNGLSVSLDKGHYFLEGMGLSEKVTLGTANFYVPDYVSAGFGIGTVRESMVGSPGNATKVITVGSYDFRSSWRNRTGKSTYYNLKIGGISDYSSPGFRRDGVIKPDFLAPGQYTISSVASKGMAEMTQEPDRDLTLDGKHVAWAGTSASCPYAAGVIALMLQKNPKLTCAQAKKIITDTASHDLETTGSVPNPAAGYGRLDPEKALAAVKTP